MNTRELATIIIKAYDELGLKPTKMLVIPKNSKCCAIGAWAEKYHQDDPDLSLDWQAEERYTAFKKAFGIICGASFGSGFDIAMADNQFLYFEEDPKNEQVLGFSVGCLVKEHFGL